MATHSSILAWRIPSDRGGWRAAVHGIAESDTTERLSTAQHSTVSNWRRSDLCPGNMTPSPCSPSHGLGVDIYSE